MEEEEKMKFTKDLGYEIELRQAVWDVMNEEEREAFMQRQLDTTFEKLYRTEIVLKEHKKKIVFQQEELRKAEAEIAARQKFFFYKTEVEELRKVVVKYHGLVVQIYGEANTGFCSERVYQKLAAVVERLVGEHASGRAPFFDNDFKVVLERALVLE